MEDHDTTLSSHIPSSGNGYLSLALARDGHKVIGLDTSQEILNVAERTRKAHSVTPDFGELTYACADIRTWQAEEGSFDLVIINRTLHHLHHLQPTLTKVKRLLTSKGQFICQDMEQYLIEKESIQAVGFRYVGSL
jgi:2-polyprenyl-3-methyl-5-hydroxy-6-metoxy-1,4-benzoquinol methylase